MRNMWNSFHPPIPGQLDRLDSVAFSTPNVETMRQYLRSNGVVVPPALTVDPDGNRSFVVHDPEGNKVVFQQDGDHPLAQPASAGRSLSSHIMHAGYMVRNRPALDHFYKDLLGFHLYWQGGDPANRVDWVMMQVPDGADWIEYMLYLPPHPSLAQLGGANHLAPGVASAAELEQKLEQRGWKPPEGRDPKLLGVDGKIQLDLTDPDGTRVEFMEYKPVKDPCCSPYTGTQPNPARRLVIIRLNKRVILSQAPTTGLVVVSAAKDLLFRNAVTSPRKPGTAPNKTAA